MMQTTAPNILLDHSSGSKIKEDLEIHLPTLKVISYNGSGNSSSGVPSSLEPLARRIGTRIHWLSVNDQTAMDLLGQSRQSGTESDTTTKVPAKQEAGESPNCFNFYTANIPDHVVKGHKSFCDQYFWPLFHGMPEIAKFDPKEWRAYKELCSIVASESQTIASQSFPTLCWLHDYQLALSAPDIATDRGAVVCQFWHVPWPKPENIASSPVIKDIIEGLLSNRLIGFHTAEYAHNFMQTIELLFPDVQVDHMNMTVSLDGKISQITVMPLGIDVDRWHDVANMVRPVAEAISVKHRLANQIILGIDRLDYSKGVLEKLHGIEYFLTVAPEMHRRFHYVQIYQAPQSGAEVFQRYADQAIKKMEEINERFTVDGWSPIIHFEARMSQEDLAAWYQAADILAVNSIRDGLNLIAKEFVACRQDEQGVLIVSKNAGCVAELSQGALVVDPRSPSEFSDAVNLAMNMPVEEKRRRMTSMRHVIGWNQLHDWALGFLKHALSQNSEAQS